MSSNAIAMDQIQDQPLISELSKAVLEKDFDHYFSLLSKEPLEKQKQLSNMAVYENGSKAIHFASEQGNLEAISRLIELGASIDEPNKWGLTPFLFATKSKNPNALLFLLEHGANKNAHVGGANALHFAAGAGNVPAIIALIKKHGFDPNCTMPESSTTPLLMAASNGHLEAITTLLNNGASKDLSDKWGTNALHQAALKGKSSAVAHLLEKHNFPINATLRNGYNALDSSLISFDVSPNEEKREIILKLLALGSKVQLSTLSAKRGITLVKNQEIIKLLKDHLSNDSEFIEHIHDHCPICHDLFFEGHFSIDKIDFESVSTTNCCNKIILHRGCLARCLATDSRCPLCRADNPA